MPDTRLPTIGDDWTVWAFSDPHGVTSGLVAALQAAGILDAALRWVAPPRTALVGCGDYVDRGADVRGLVALLRRLESDADAAGGAVRLARGNHEAMLLTIGAGAGEWLETWLQYGGDATLASFGYDAHAHAHDAPGVVACLEAGAPGLFRWLDGLAHAVRWRDVLFVHGGLPPHHAPHELGITTQDHLWIRSAFFDTAWDSPAFDAYRAAGIERVVFGHTPQPSGATLFQDGHSLDIDTNAVGNPRLPVGAVQQITLLRLRGEDALDGAHVVTVSTLEAPERMPRPATS